MHCLRCGFRIHLGPALLAHQPCLVQIPCLRLAGQIRAIMREEDPEGACRLAVVYSQALLLHSTWPGNSDASAMPCPDTPYGGPCESHFSPLNLKVPAVHLRKLQSTACAFTQAQLSWASSAPSYSSHAICRLLIESLTSTVVVRTQHSCPCVQSSWPCTARWAQV